MINKLKIFLGLAWVMLLTNNSAAQSLSELSALDASQPLGFYIQLESDMEGYNEGDAELCIWALSDWVKQTQGLLNFQPAEEEEAIIRVYFVSLEFGQYGEMRPFLLDGRRGAAVYVRPDINALGPDISQAANDDPLLRDTIVYLTCLHELGHALGLEHTAEFSDVMYLFGYGGDIPLFFSRYRDRLNSRDDITEVSGVSNGDLMQLRTLYGF